MTDLRYAEHLATFVDVVRTGSFSGAARRRGSSASAIVRQIDALEALLGAKLLLRSTRALRTTDAGERFYRRAQRLLADLIDTRAEIQALDGRVAGELRVACMPTFGKRYVLPALARLMAAHHDLFASADFSERLAEPVADRLDAVIRIGELTDTSLIATKLGDQARYLVASPAYLEAGRPDNRVSVADFRLIDKMTGADLLGWRDIVGTPLPAQPAVAVAFRCNDFEALRSAAIAGSGLALLPDWLVEQDIATGRLVRLRLDDEPWNASLSGIYLLRALSDPPAKVRALIAALRAELGNAPNRGFGAAD